MDSPHGKKQKRRPGVAVPSWYDLPLLLPDADPVLGRLQRRFLETLDHENDSDLQPDAAGFVVPAVSRLSPEKHVTKSGRLANHWRKERGKMVLVRPRKTTQSGAAVVLDRLDHRHHHPNQATQSRPSRRRERLRDKLWNDLSRFGLWHIDRTTGGESMRWDGEDDGMRQETAASVDATVDSIMSQWQYEDNEEIDGGDSDVSASAVFLTAVPVSPPANERRKSIVRVQNRTVAQTVPEEEEDSRRSLQEEREGGGEEEDGGDPELEVDDDDEDEEEEPPDSSLASRFRRNIQAPGQKRRQRLKELHVFVETQLQKRLCRSWDTIEIALAGSGDLSVTQIVRFLQHSDVKLSAVDAAKVQSILHQHIDNQRLAKQQAASSPSASPSLEPATSAPPAKISYAAFRKLFQPRDPQETIRWKREFDREKLRLRQEKEIYDRELAALEQKVQQRLAESAKHMVELLHSFRCDPLAIPWATEEQRLALRAELVRIVFSKPPRRRLSQAGAAISASLQAAAAADPSTSTSLNDQLLHLVPQTVSVPKLRSALLQKYSRNGHFESVPVPAAAYVFHDLAADAIKSSIRALWKRREIDLWPERQLIFQFRLLKSVFFEWHWFTKHAFVLRAHVLRKFVAWALWMKRWRAYYAFYRRCFWPFYVWKRHLQQQIIARGKSVFLRNVVVTYIQLRHFRAWQTRFRRKSWGRKQVLRLQKKRARLVVETCWCEWRERLRVHLAIHRVWKSRGHVLQQLHKGYMVKVTFFLWRYYSILRQDQCARRYKCFHAQFPPIGAVKHRPTIQATGNGRGAGVPQLRGYQASPQPSRGVSWLAQPPASSSLAGSRSGSMATAYKTSSGNNGSPAADADASDEGLEITEETTVEVRALSKIMETSLAPKIKRKTRLYDLCLDLYLRFRERDRRAMTGNIICFRRVGRAFFQGMRKYVSHQKKNRLATDLGAFRHLYKRFRWWVAQAIYKHPVLNGGSREAASHGKENESDTIDSEDDDRPGQQTRGDVYALDWKRDTAWRLHGLANLPVEAGQLRQDLLAITIAHAQRQDRVHDLEAQLREKKRLEDAFLRKQAGATLKVRALQMQQAQQILRTRGHRLHDVLDRAFDVLLAHQRLEQLKSTFRGLRVAMMQRYTTTLCHRAQLRNWLRLARRFAFWQANATRFYSLRLQFQAFRSLLRNAVFKWQHESHGVSARLQQRQTLLWKYDQYLDRHRLLDGSAAAARLAMTKYSPANAFHGVFLRWVQHTQLSRTHREIITLVHRKHELSQLQLVFTSLRTSLKAKYTAPQRRQQRPFLWRQCVADLDAIHCKVLALRTRLPSQKLRRQLRLTQHHVQHTATGAPTLKQRFQLHEDEIRHRLFLESRLMFTAYNERRVHHYAERTSGLVGAPVGRQFAYEPAPPYGSISEVVVVCGKKVDALSLVVKSQASATVEGTLHGNAFGNREVFTLARTEKLVAIEGFASQSIYGLRFATSSGRISKWFGNVEKGTRFELRSDWVGKREEIVGVWGFADATSLHALGAVYRLTTERNIFEGMWLSVSPPASSSESPGPAPSSSSLASMDTDTQALCDRQFAYFLQVRMCDVLLAMKRAHRFALRVHRLAATLPWPLARPRVLLALTRWLFNSLAHGLVKSSGREDEGRRVLQDGLQKRATGERALEDGAKLLAEVDSYRDSERQLQVAALGTKKVLELQEMAAQGEHKIVTGQRLLEEGALAVRQGRRLLPHIPLTKRMLTAIRRMYKVVQTKDYIDQMDPELRAILLEGDAVASATPGSIYDAA